MMRPHWPRWAVHVVEDVEHQGELNTLAFVIITTMLLGTLLVATAATLDALVQALR